MQVKIGVFWNSIKPQELAYDVRGADQVWLRRKSGAEALSTNDMSESVSSRKKTVWILKFWKYALQSVKDVWQAVEYYLAHLLAVNQNVQKTV